MRKQYDVGIYKQSYKKLLNEGGLAGERLMLIHILSKSQMQSGTANPVER